VLQCQKKIKNIKFVLNDMFYLIDCCNTIVSEYALEFRTVNEIDELRFCTIECLFDNPTDKNNFFKDMESKKYVFTHKQSDKHRVPSLQSGRVPSLQSGRVLCRDKEVCQLEILCGNKPKI